jgi:hypothetical protein
LISSAFAGTTIEAEGEQMQFSFTEEQQLFADSVRKFALAHLD